MLYYSLTILPVGLAAVIVWCTIKVVVSGRGLEHIDLPSVIPLDRLGVIERDLPHLRSVIVIADRVERPTAVLHEAVESNFERDVKYLFLVSRDRAQREVDGYYTLFEALARIVLSRRSSHATALNDLIEIKQLPYSWDDYPYIFYNLHLPSGQTRTLAFRGDSVNRGIADHYESVEPAYANTIARAIVSDAPQAIADLEIERGDFTMPANVLDFEQSKPRARMQ